MTPGAIDVLIGILSLLIMLALLGGI